MKYKKNQKIILNKDITTFGAVLRKGEEITIVVVDKIFRCYDIENNDGVYITDVNEVDLE